MINPINASVITPLALSIFEVFPALVRYINPPIVIIRRAAIPTVQIPNLYNAMIKAGKSVAPENPGMGSRGV